MEIQELHKYLEIGKLPVLIYCEEKYNGIWCMLQLTKNNKIFLDFTDNINSNSEGDFRTTFVYDSFEELLKAVENFTGRKVSELSINPDVTHISGSNPAWLDFQWDLYNGKVKMLENYKKIFIGDLWWRFLFQKKVKPDCSTEKLNALIMQRDYEY